MYLAMTDGAIAKELGKRLKALRLRFNRTQINVAEDAGIALNAVKGAEQGKSTLLTYIKILRVFNALDSLDSFLPQPEISPIQMAKIAARKRKIASSPRSKKGMNNE